MEEKERKRRLPMKLKPIRRRKKKSYKKPKKPKHAQNKTLDLFPTQLLKRLNTKTSIVSHLSILESESPSKNHLRMNQPTHRIMKEQASSLVHTPKSFRNNQNSYLKLGMKNHEGNLDSESKIQNIFNTNSPSKRVKNLKR